MVTESTLNFVQNEKMINSVKLIQNDVKAQNDEEVTPEFIRAVLRKQLDMRFSKVKKIPNQANSLRNLKMR